MSVKSGLEVWLETGKKVTIAGREFVMMPLPLKRLYKVMDWLETASNDVIHDAVKADGSSTTKVPNPLGLVSRVLNKVDVSEVCFELFSYPKDDDGNPINKNITKEWLDDRLDIPSAHKCYKAFVEINEVEEIIKNLQSLPVMRKIMEAAQLVFGTQFLNLLQQNTTSAQSKSEGSPSLKSTDISTHSTTGGLTNGLSKESLEETLMETETKNPTIQ